MISLLIGVGKQIIGNKSIVGITPDIFTHEVISDSTTLDFGVCAKCKYCTSKNIAGNTFLDVPIAPHFAYLAKYHTYTEGEIPPASVVFIEESRPISKSKKWVVVTNVVEAKG